MRLIILIVLIISIPCFVICSSTSSENPTTYKKSATVTTSQCSYKVSAPFDAKGEVFIKEVKIHKHLYVVASFCGIYKGGVSIIHSEACPCLQKIN